MEDMSSLKKIIDQIGAGKFALILRAVLDRIPIVLIGRDSTSVDELVDTLVSLAPHRHQYIFRTDFMLPEEYMNLCQEENDNFTIPRGIFSSCSTDSPYIFQTLEDLKGWVLGFDITDELKKVDIISNMSNITLKFLIINQDLDKYDISLTGWKENGLDLQLEKKIIERAIKNTDVAVEKMKRVIKKRIKVDPSKGVMESIMEFDTEAEQIQSNIFDSEIKAFAHAGERALSILNRIDLLINASFKIQISGKTLLETIDYQEVDYERLLQFVQAEYGVDFAHCIKGGRSAAVGDRLDGFWG